MFVSSLWTPWSSVVGKYLFFYSLAFASSGPGPRGFKPVGINFLVKMVPKASRVYLNRPHCRCPRVSPPASGAFPRPASQWSGRPVPGSTESRDGSGKAFPGHLSHLFRAGECTDSSLIQGHPTIHKAPTWTWWTGWNISGGNARRVVDQAAGSTGRVMYVMSVKTFQIFYWNWGWTCHFDSRRNMFWALLYF